MKVHGTICEIGPLLSAKRSDEDWLHQPKYKNADHCLQKWNSHRVTTQFLWFGDDRYNPRFFEEEPNKTQNGRAPLQSAEHSAFIALLRTCAKTKDLDRGIRVHDEIAKRGLLEKCSDALVTMYAKCGSLAKSRELLDTYHSRDVFCWTALMTEYSRQGKGENALECFEQMRQEGLTPDAVTFACILKACGSIGAADKGEQLHQEIAREGLLENDPVLGNTLVDMYVKCGNLTKAQQVLEDLCSRDIVSWNALIIGYTQHGQTKQALECFEWMQREGLLPNAVTLACILQACGNLGAVDRGKEIHDDIARRGLLGKDIVLGTALVDMYAKCGSLTKARQVLEEFPFRDVIAWTALIAGYAEQGQGEEALRCWEQMQHEGLSPNVVTFASILKACGSIGAIEKGEQIHDEVVCQGLLRNNIVLGSALVDMYAKCGAIAKAQQVFAELPSRDVVSWSALIAGFAQQGQSDKALNCFKQMQCEGFTPNAVTYISILQACGSTGMAEKGKEIHDEIARQGLLGSDTALGNAVVDMYVKCGALAAAQKVLEELSSRNSITWNALISGYAQHGESAQVLKCFNQMQDEGIWPDSVVLSCILNACSHLGLVEDGNLYFVNMTSQYGIEPTIEHYSCMVDLFGRAGHLDKAVQVIQEMPSSNYSAVWLALLGACQKWGDLIIGRWAFEQAVHVDKSEVAPYVLMANIYAAAGMQEEAKCIAALRMANKAWKNTVGQHE